MMSRWTRLLALAVLLAGLAASAKAQNVYERLVSPGEVIEGHAKYEQDCTSCHKPFDQKAQKGLCLGCHKDVAADLQQARGFHGKRGDIANTDCRHCHTDHKGRKADIIRLDRDTFDHTTTDFALAGRHLAAPCAGCHPPGKKFRTAPGACIDCHKSSDVHRGNAGQECATCHQEQGWRQLKPFDHGKTKFALTGAHTGTACRSCHAAERFKGLTAACGDCHRDKDKHRGQLGAKCESCHDTVAWVRARFDHDKDTKFALRGKHGPAECAACHKPAHAVKKPATACQACHAKEDVHKGQLGPLCQNCHNESGWAIGILFDHAKARFALLGKHAGAPCGDCHKTKVYRDTPMACVACHQRKDSHDGRLGADCGLCHNADAWRGARFQHDKRTRFALTGQHASASCYACHRQRGVVKATLPRDCYACHQAQDRHRGAFGRDCGKCHTTATFAVAYIRR